MSSKVRTITLGRLYNLGNYEHIRYEIAVDLDPAEDPSEMLIGLSRIMESLKPLEKYQCPTERSLERARKDILRHEAMSDEEYEREHFGATSTRRQYIDFSIAQLKRDTERREEAIAKREKAHKMLDALGGAAKWTDAKLDWEDW